MDQVEVTNADEIDARSKRRGIVRIAFFVLL